MKKKKKFQKSSVKRQRDSNTRDAPSRPIAKKKSKKLSGQKETLRIATPQNIELQHLEQLGIVVPEEIEGSDDLVPLDFTTLNNRRLGALHSRYAVRHSHVIFHLALSASTLARLRRDLRIEEAKFRARKRDDYKAKWELDDAMLKSKKIGKFHEKISVSEASVELLQAIAGGYEDLRNAASREMTRRISEKAATD